MDYNGSDDLKIVLIIKIGMQANDTKGALGMTGIVVGTHMIGHRIPGAAMNSLKCEVVMR